MATQYWKCEKCGEQFRFKDEAEKCESSHTEQIVCLHKHAFFSVVIICTKCNPLGGDKPEKVIPITDPYLRKVFGK